ncbi:MAG TPA: outer membrane protein [Bradyrhizobium sp.]|nr:outer membrane protein [Bradyrhizobium sp.]
MKRQIVLTAALLTAVSGSAMAADLYKPAPSDYTKAPIIAPVYNWTGFYVGGNFGYGWGKADSDFAFTPTALGGGGPTTTSSNSQKVNGALGGAQIGFNWQTNAVVWGVEADFQGADQRNSFQNLDRNPADVIAADGAPDNGFGAQPGEAIISTLNQSLKWFGTARGRIGYLPDPRWLVYATGGFAYGRVSSDLTVIDPDGDTSHANWSENRTGWVAGVGVEAALSDSWTWKFEYLHVDLGSGGSTSPFTGLPGSPFIAGVVVANAAINTRFTDEIVRLGVNYKFRY